MKRKRRVNRVIALAMSLVVVLCAVVPASAQVVQKPYTALYDSQKVKAELLKNDEKLNTQYPNGALMFPVVNAKLEMQEFYAIEIYRQGSTAGDATVTLESVDYTAGYGIDYEIYLSRDYGEEAVQGQTALFYAVEQYSFIPVVASGEVATDTDDADNSALETLSAISNDYADLITPSSSTQLTFKDGENSKTIYIKTIKDDTVTDDLEFILRLKDANGCDIGLQSTAGFTIIEDREKPEAQITVSDTTVNPESDVAYVTVSRGGNLGGYSSYRVVTQESTAKSGEAYEPVQMQLDFLPGMSEQKVPINILNAQDGESFKVLLENVKNATALSTQATVTFSQTAQVTSTSQTMVASYAPNKSTNRASEYVPITSFTESVHTNRGPFSQDWWFDISTDSTYAELGYSNDAAAYNNAISIRTKDKINFSGVDQISMVIDNYTGSCSWDHNAIYVADSDKFSSSTSDYDWLDDLDDDGIGNSWDMTNVSDGHIVRSTGTLNQSKVGGEHYLYIILHKGAFGGTAEFKILSDGNSTDNVLLHLTEYNLSILNPDQPEVYIDGKLTKLAHAGNWTFSDPAVSSDSTSTFVTKAAIYRNESVAIKGAFNSEISSHMRMKGVYLCDPDNTSKTSELISLSTDSFTLTPEIISKYGGFIKNNNIIIKPVYAIDTAQVEVGEYSYNNGMKITKNSDGYSANVYNNDELLGTLSWTKSERANNAYCIGDKIKFEFTGVDGKVDSACVYADVQSASSSTAASAVSPNTYRSTTNTLSVDIKDLYTKIVPYISYIDLGVQLTVTNPQYGSFSGKDGDYALTNTDGTVGVSGYKLSDGTSVMFDDLSVGSTLSIFAQPNSGYRAKWTYTDSITNTEKVYYGNAFFFMVQYALDKNDNNIQLTFEKIDTSKQKNYKINGKVTVQKGSVLNPPNLESDIYEIMPMASVTIGDYMGISDTTGVFFLETNPTGEDSQMAEVAFIGDETIRVLAMANNQYYITDVDVSDFITADTTDTLTLELKLDYQTYGAVPESITATDNQNNAYGDTIPLVTAKAIQFDLLLDLENQDEQKPINTVKWTVESEDSVTYTSYVDLESGSSKSHFATVLSEIVRPGMSLYVELMHKSTDSNGDNHYTSFGKYNTGYNFIATAVEETVTYMPDIGAPSTMKLTAPCIGPFSPTFSLKGFTPVFNVGSSGTDSEGRELKTVTIGLNLTTMKNYVEDNPKFKTLSAKDKQNLLQKTLDGFFEYYTRTGTTPKFSAGKGLADAVKLKTAVKLNISFALCYQGSYYVDEQTGDWMFVSHLTVAGFGGKLSISVPFTFFYIPCFTYITFGLEANIYVGTFPNADAQTGETVALTLTQLDDAELSHIQGVYQIGGAITFGLGIGFDGIVSASGNITAKLDIQFNDFLRGVVNLGMSGGVSVEFLIFKYSWSEDFLNVELYNSLPDNPSTLNAVRSAFSYDLMRKTTLRDMSLETATDQSNLNLTASLAGGENVIANSSTLVSPSITQIDESRYMITDVVTAQSKITGKDTHKLYYVIYDSTTETITDSGFVLDKFISDVTARSADSMIASQQVDNLDSDVILTDCGDDILITWTKLKNKITDDTDNLELIKSLGIASIYYNKSTGKFHDYSMNVSDKADEVYINPKVAYDKDTGLVQMFYEKADVSSVTLDTTLEQLQNIPTTLAAKYINVNENLKDWSEEIEIAISDNALNYYDVHSLDGKIMLSFVGGAKKGFTLEDISGYEYDEDFNADGFNTENSLYIQQFSLNGNTLNIGSQIKITADGYVSANPEFAHINSNGVDNLLLFYKCNGLYAYQNINTLISQGVYIDENGEYKLNEDYMKPQFITDDEDHTVNDDFMIVSDEENIYALWTTTEGTQQQIWARSFCIDGHEEVNGTLIRDTDGNVIYDENGNPKLSEYDQPIYLLKGYWGGKTYLTQGGLNGTDSGMFKKNFDAVVTDDGDLLTVYNAYDTDYSNEGIAIENNKVVVAKYDTDTEYETSDVLDEITFSNDYPSAGETVRASAMIGNKGVLNGENVTAALFVNGKEYAHNTYSHWLTAEWKSVEFDYVMPDNIKAEDVKMQIKVYENGAEKFATDTYSLSTGESLSLNSIAFAPIKNIGKNSDSAAYRVTAVVENVGNEDYTSGKFVRVLETDLQNLTASLNEETADPNAAVYTAYGECEITNIKAGEVKTVTFDTKDIPKSVFEKSAGGITAYLEGIITDSAQLDKTVFTADDEITILSEFYPGLTMIAKDAEVKTLSLADLSLIVGNSKKIETTVTPSSALATCDITYTSSDESVATVDNLGIVTAVGEGVCTITATANGVTSTAQVSVQKIDDTPTLPSGNDENTDSNNDTTNTADTTDTDSAVNTGVANDIHIIVVSVIAVLALSAMLIFKRKREE